MADTLSTDQLAVIRDRARCVASNPSAFPASARTIAAEDAPALLVGLERLGRLADSSYSAALQKDAEIERLRAKLALLRDPHERHESGVCMDCASTWPCRTARIVDGAS